MNVAPSAVRLPSTSPEPPLQIELRFRLDVPPDAAFELVTTRLSEWFTAIHAVTWNHERSESGAGTLGACSERVCDFGGKTLVENIVSVEPGRRYAYSADMPRSQMKMPLRDHLGTFEVERSERGSVIVWRQHFRALWFVPTAMLRWQMRDKMMRPALDSLIKKYGGEWISVQ